MCGRSWCRGRELRRDARKNCGNKHEEFSESLNRGKKGWSWTLLLQIRNRELEQDRGQRVCRVQTRVLNCCHWYFRKATTTVIIEAFSTNQNSAPNFALWVLYSEGSRFPKVSMSTLHWWTLVATVGVAMTTHNRDRVSFVQDQGWGSGGTETERQPLLGTHR